MTLAKNKLRRGRAGQHRQRGVGMIEVLIALTISAFALLGLAGLQVSSLRYQKVANFRSLAGQYSADIADRIRANSANAKAGYYTTTDKYSSASPTAPTCTTAGACTPQENAKLDIYNWRVGLNQAMAGGWGTISGDTTNGFVVTVYYNEPGKASVNNATEPCDTSVFDASATTADKNAMRCFLTVVMP
ncbi:type IV pilus modification protein PilV [Paraherbaspirillum soli]|uniref:Type IV pilus modification protein PilV n=1 Tax=Paraherbaspirillum soli TaxID=631222 RepID=A0ABW0M3I5_9BURK